MLQPRTDYALTLDMAKEKVLLKGLRGPANHDGGALSVLGDKLFIPLRRLGPFRPMMGGALLGLLTETHVRKRYADELERNQRELFGES